MTIHSCRDLILGGWQGLATGAYDTMWAIGAFVQGVLGYTTQSSAGNALPNLDPRMTINYYSWAAGIFTQTSASVIPGNTACAFISSSGGHTLLKFSSDMVNLSASAQPSGWPSGPWPNQNPLSGAWAVIRSTANPLANSGIFQITDVTSWLNVNAVEIDYRTVSSTIQETGSYVTCSIMIPPPGSDDGSILSNRGRTRTGGSTWTTFNTLAASGDTTKYQGSGSSTYPRILFKSPSSLNWYMRLALESTATIAFGNSELTTGPALTMIPGLSGTTGDFSPGPGVGTTGSLGSHHLHGPQWFNFPLVSGSKYSGTMPALDYILVPTTGSVAPGGNGTSCRYGFYAWGDDVTGTCVIMIRNRSGTRDVFTVFGMPEDETPPPGAGVMQRLFVVGQTQRNLGGVTWSNGPSQAVGVAGMAFSFDSRSGPVTCNMGCPTFVSRAASDATNIRFDAAAGVSPFTGLDDLLSADLFAGLFTNNRNYSDVEFLPCEPRRMGRVPIIRFGRSTGVTTWATADDAKLWFHASSGMYLPWGGLAAS